MTLPFSPSTTAYLFPGQGSQKVGMGQRLAQKYPTARSTFEAADELLGFDLSRLAWEGPSTELDDTINTQPALFVHSIAVLRVFREQYSPFKPSFVAGHSMGELSALVAAEALSFEDGLRLVRRRGELMKRAGEENPGGMAAVLGLDIAEVENICHQASCDIETVQIANDNCPGQTVISGTITALGKAIELASAKGARRVIRLDVSIASHSHLMAACQSTFAQVLAQTTFQDPGIPVISNVTALPLTTASQIRADLLAQLTSRVKWSDSMKFLLSQGVHTFMELGSGNVLCGLLHRIDRTAMCFPLDSPEDFDKLAL
ncbi:MAG: ACP S-malonyltransferase [Chloroflexota bacterium]